MEVVELAAGQHVYMQGDTGSRFYIIKEGSVTCSKTTDPAKPPAVFTLNAGQFFGERALLKDEVRQAPFLTLLQVCRKPGCVQQALIAEFCSKFDLCWVAMHSVLVSGLDMLLTGCNL